MCGILGAISNSFLSDEDRWDIQKLFILNQFRGPHSGGMFDLVESETKSKKNPQKVYSYLPIKTAKHPSHVFYTQWSENNRQRWKHPNHVKFIVGHCRFATKGDITDANAHPFIFDDIIGVHNGTVVGKFKYSDDFETDSEALYKLIAEEGVEEALKRVWKESTNAAYALVFYDKKDRSLNFLRNQQRPLHYCFQKDVLLFSSDKKDLQYTLGTTVDIEQFEVNRWYKWKVSDAESKAKDIFEIKDVSQYSTTGNYGMGYHSSEWGGEAWGNTLYKSTSAPSSASKHWTVQQWRAAGNFKKTEHYKHFDLAFGRWYEGKRTDELEAWVDKNSYGYSTELAGKMRTEPPETVQLWHNDVDSTKGYLSEKFYKFFESYSSHGKQANIVPFKEDGKQTLLPFGGNVFLSKQDWLKRVKGGCVYCANIILPEDASSVFWTNENEPLCRTCQEEANKTEDHILHHMVDKTKFNSFTTKRSA